MDWKQEAKAAHQAKANEAEEEAPDSRTLADLLSDMLGVTAEPEARVVTQDGVVIRMSGHGELHMQVPMPDGSFYGGPVRSKEEAGALLEAAENRARQM